MLNTALLISLIFLIWFQRWLGSIPISYCWFLHSELLLFSCYFMSSCKHDHPSNKQPMHDTFRVTLTLLWTSPPLAVSSAWHPLLIAQTKIGVPKSFVYAMHLQHYPRPTGYPSNTTVALESIAHLLESFSWRLPQSSIPLILRAPPLIKGREQIFFISSLPVSSSYFRQ